MDRCLSAAPCSKLTKGEGWSSLIAGALLKYVISIYVNHLHSIIEDFQPYGRMTKKTKCLIRFYWYLWLNPAALALPSWSYMYIELPYFELSHVTLALHNFLHVIMIFVFITFRGMHHIGAFVQHENMCHYRFFLFYFLFTLVTSIYNDNKVMWSQK